MTTRAKKDDVETPEVDDAQLDDAVIGTQTASVDLTSGSQVIKYHTPPQKTNLPLVGSTVTGTGIGTNAVVLGSPEPTPEQFTVSVASTATSSAATATFNQAGAPEQSGVLVSWVDGPGYGWFGRRDNAHADAEFTVPGLVNGASPGDYLNPAA